MSFALEEEGILSVRAFHDSPERPWEALGSGEVRHLRRHLCDL